MPRSCKSAFPISNSFARRLERADAFSAIGRFNSLDRSFDVVEVLQATPFSVVEGVRTVNRTTGRSTRRIATGIDGSLHGEIPLTPGENEIELAAGST